MGRSIKFCTRHPDLAEHRPVPATPYFRTFLGRRPSRQAMRHVPGGEALASAPRAAPGGEAPVSAPRVAAGEGRHSAGRGPAAGRLDPASLTPQGWRDLVEGLGLSGLAGELALNSILVGSDAHRLTIELDPAHAALNATGAREGLRRALAARFGDSIELEVVLNSPAAETPAAGRARDEASRRQAAIRAIEEDPRVRTLCETFGTSVDPRLVRPID